MIKKDIKLSIQLAKPIDNKQILRQIYSSSFFNKIFLYFYVKNAKNDAFFEQFLYIYN